MRILVVEDNIDFQIFLKMRLCEKCFAVDATAIAKEGLALARENRYDIVLLDYSLPEMNGYEFCSKLREQGKQMPIIMISGKSDVLHKVDGFSLGIDDYLVKPFYFEELLARMHAILRRPPLRASPIYRLDDLRLDTAKQQVWRGKRSIYLTRKEFSLLEYLLKNTGVVASRGEIIDHVWDSSTDLFSNTIETHILNLRKKINLPRRRALIHSISGRGYKADIAK